MSRRLVWAPRPKTVELHHAGRLHALRRDDEGWWRFDGRLTGPYWLVVDGDRLPDPRSPWQPEGVDGPSHSFDPSAHVWTDQRWHGRPLGSSIIYELHVGTFTDEGTFDAAARRLRELRDLGVTAVELMPVAEFPGRRGWGYDGVLLYAPHHAYGGPAGLQRFVDAAHALDLAVVLDVVYNHLGPSGNHLSRFGPYFTDEYTTPWGEAVNLDGPGSDEVRRFFVDNACRWITEFHIDGLRLDAVHALFDRSATPFVEELAAAVHETGRRAGRTVWVIAENDLNDPRMVVSPERGGSGVDAVWNDDFHHALHAVLTGERDGYFEGFGALAELAKALDDVFVFDGRYSPFRGHVHGRAVGDLARDRFIGYLQTHDQVGNRALGERLHQLVSRRRAEIGAALVLTSPFVPMLFQGEEWAASAPFQYFTDHTDPELARLVTEGRRREFGGAAAPTDEVPDPQDPETFRRSTLNWAERSSFEHAETYEWHRRLIRLRRGCPSFTSADARSTRTRFDESARWLCVERGDHAVAVNLGTERRAVPLPATATEIVLTNDDDAIVADGQVFLGPDTVAIVGPDPTTS